MHSAGLPLGVVCAAYRHGWAFVEAGAAVFSRQKSEHALSFPPPFSLTHTHTYVDGVVGLLVTVVQVHIHDYSRQQQQQQQQ
jgi:hypothetical protein